ncbi:acyltransferase [Bordetella genomosp. 12]|uniref:N-acetyltransferase n=1 Tax=Bordetella genomosp. 12 TaxID=463035 RepID=A0A261VF67_9BORD|nr:acyltransferase [Bordetella genomosp. 12]OZI72192.1 N-acetyltransferase [Bordetella genomosp. 12]
MTATPNFFVHATAEVSPKANIGEGTKIWNYAQVREGVTLGSECIVGKNVYIDFDVRIGSRCKIQNNCSLYHGAELEDGVFVGPHVILTNDKKPRAITPDGQLKGNSDWEVGPIRIRRGAALGAGSIILPNVTVGQFALVGAGAVVTRDVPDYALVAGNPAKVIGWVDAEGNRVEQPPSA